MSPRHLPALLLLALLLAAAPARAESERLREARELFDAGDWAAAALLVDELERENLLASEADLVEAWRILGLSRLYLGNPEAARSAFVKLLSTDPDYTLDPLVVSPLAIAEFEKVREEKAEQLQPIRDRRREIAEKRRQEEEARRKLLEDEKKEQREREKASATVLLQRVDRHSFLTNFLPFGAAQLEQDRSQVGALLAVGQGLGIAGTVLTYSQVRSYIGDDGKVAPNKLQEARGWRTANWIVFGATAALYLGGIIDAVLHYEEETVTNTTMPRELLLSPPQSPAPSRPAGPSAGVFLAPLEGGGAAGLAGTF